MPRIAGRQYRQAAPLPGRDRQAQVREQLEGGTTDPALIAQALGVSREAVLYHARKMTDVEIVYDHANRRRITLRWSAARASATGAAA